ncbi:ABC-F family ATP-binding cassette domain-containing protein [Cellulomonas bogoriensis]|uniref:ABC-F family ATP-binding cassette domain-containing protein n=1 Tax=Cellulomonas bogoriensis TaxID=301388 RepID=UPI00068CD77A|nr:ABC-F family ATP-binding cassette domain-containing protein [Cellulomonas bogoriensis]
MEGVSVSFGNRRVLTDVSFTVGPGQRAGLIGENGSGKTTVLRVAAGVLVPDSGQVHVTAPGGRPRVGLLHQEPPFSLHSSVAQVLDDAVAPVRAAARAVDEAAARLATTPDEPSATAYARALESAERHGAWDVDARIGQMLDGLGLADVPRDLPTGHLSGGRRARLSLAWVLLNDPDVLLLDEPTNHLDDAATAHLGSVLRSWAGPVLIASHDRAFLDETVTTLLDLDPAPTSHVLAAPLVGDGPGTGMGVARFTGTFTDYLHARLDARERWEIRYRDEQARLKRLRAAVRDSRTVGHRDWQPRTESRIAAKFYADRNATAVSRRVNDARSRLEDLEREQVRRPPAELWFRGLSAASASTRTRSGPVLLTSAATVAGRLAATSLQISAGEKLLVTGPNGSGKSTLLHLLAGHLVPTSGTLTVPGGVRVGLLTQDVNLPDPHGRGESRTARQVYDDAVGAQRSADVPLATFGLVAGRDENRPVGVLSSGQRRRLALAILLADPPDVLLLDEPTNHLSLMLATQLEAAIGSHPGTVVVASHDRWLRRTWTGRHLHLEGWPMGCRGEG